MHKSSANKCRCTWDVTPFYWESGLQIDSDCCNLRMIDMGSSTFSKLAIDNGWMHYMPERMLYHFHQFEQCNTHRDGHYNKFKCKGFNKANWLFPSCAQPPATKSSPPPVPAGCEGKANNWTMKGWTSEPWNVGLFSSSIFTLYHEILNLSETVSWKEGIKFYLTRVPALI